VGKSISSLFTLFTLFTLHTLFSITLIVYIAEILDYLLLFSLPFPGFLSAVHPVHLIEPGAARLRLIPAYHPNWPRLNGEKRPKLLFNLNFKNNPRSAIFTGTPLNSKFLVWIVV
jgi:hypothetical protein